MIFFFNLGQQLRKRSSLKTFYSFLVAILFGVAELIRNFGRGASNRIPTGKFVSNLRTFEGLHKDPHSVFKDYYFMKNTNLNYKILLLKI